MKIQINDQRREFVNEVSKVLHNMIGTEQCITSVYLPQSNGLCEQQNRTIKNSLMKVLDGNGGEGVLTFEVIAGAISFVDEGSGNGEESHDTEKVDKQILIEERFDNYAITKLLNEIIEIILVDEVKSSKDLTETYVI